MNILPHKSWHVRTKKNIARVRKDEAKAAEEEKETQRRVALAAQEARTSFLRERANHRIVENGEEIPTGIPLTDVADIIQKDGHVNFFQDIEDGRKQEKINVDHEAEKRKEQEDYEKKIGYLVYLGQNSTEHSKDKPWYATIDRTKSVDLTKEKEKFKNCEVVATSLVHSSKNTEFTTEELKLTKFKEFHDPLKNIRQYLSTPGVKKKFEESTGSVTLKRKSKTDESNSRKHSKKSKKEKKKHKHKSKSKKHKKHKEKRKLEVLPPSSTENSSSSDSEEESKRRNLQILRAERLEREREERKRADKVLAAIRGEPLPEDKEIPTSSMGRAPVKQRYNSQFNPQLARQNFSND